ncbi:MULTISPECIES: hypothetical protein [unclassified Pseudomonas]|uniref:tyrosine-type recombinase/integrase n=1 Tax=unclassified Pseudomonas TaxID=196821 RepID=UPI0011BE0919|nr:hypothetical protein [Pseudomonas sp. MWU12-2020]
MRVIFPAPDRMHTLGYPKLAYVPFLIADDGSYPVEANRYLRERACLEWRPKVGYGEERFRFNRSLTINSLDAMARRLMEFLLWCNKQKNSNAWREVTYQDDLIDKWQVGMLDGSASRSQKRLSNETVNARVAEACYFLIWAAERGYRESFDALVSLRGSQNQKLRRRNNLGSVRVAALPPERSRLSLPTEKALSKWKTLLKIRHGEVMSLFAEFLIKTGVRISEGIGLRANDLPGKNFGEDKNSWRDDWVAAGEVPCTICMGIKGPKVFRGSQESVTSRQIYIPIELADRMDNYKREGRATLILRWITSGKSRIDRDRRKKIARTDQFWIGKRGRPLTAGWVRQAWSSVECGPWKWSPHRARHEFAVNTIVDYTQSLIDVAKIPEIPSAGWLHGLMAGQVQIILSPLLGHIDEKTTMIYLAAARERLLSRFVHPVLIWQKECDE